MPLTPEQQDQHNKTMQIGASLVGIGCLAMMLPGIIICVVILFSIIGSMFN